MPTVRQREKESAPICRFDTWDSIRNTATGGDLNQPVELPSENAGIPEMWAQALLFLLL
jgi:hypothetical protein